jgi:glucokinase
MEILSFDIGGSSIKRAIVTVRNGDAQITNRLESIPLHTHTFDEVREQVIRSVADHSKRAWQRTNVAISTSGAVNRSGFVSNSGHFEGYVDVDWAKILKAALPKSVGSVVVVNDGKASTWAEYQRVGRGDEVFVHFVVGTGVGGGIVCFDKILYGDDETAGALGHMKVGGPNGIECSCESREGCVETRASGPAIARAFGELRGGLSDTATFDDTFLAAKKGDRKALEAFSVGGQWLGVAIANVINVLNPRHITVGGGVMQASIEIDLTDGGPYLKSAVKRAREVAFEDIAEATIIRPATAGNDGGLIGAALFASAMAKRT